MPYTEVMTHEELSELFCYDPETGKIWWRVKSASKVIAGTEAGCVKGTRKDAAGNSKAYRYISVHGKSMPASRVAWVLHHGEWPVGKVMFQDKNPLNLRATNLYMSNSVAGTYDHTDEGGRADYHRAYKQENQVDWRDKHLRSRFDMSLSEYADMVVAQGNKCAICAKAETETRSGKTKALAVDHDHTSGAIRGLLCVACNTGIGKLGDDPERLRAAADYIEHHAAKVTPLRVVGEEG